MACIDSDGTLTPTGISLLEALAEEPMPPEDIAKHVGEPIFRVRGSLRELAGADLVEEREGLYSLTEEGKSRI